MDQPPQILIAIDPGASGGIAAWSEEGGEVKAFKMPDTEGGIVQLLRELGLKQPTSTTVFMERVGGYIGHAQPASSAFNFGHNAGFLLGVCMTLGLRVELVMPQKWQKPFSLGSSKACASKTEWKNKIKSLAERLFPNIKVTLATSDALMILEWGRRFSNT